MPDAAIGAPVRRWRVVAATVILGVMGILSVRNGLSEHVAPVAWGGEVLWIGLASGVGAALIAVGIIYLSGSFRNTNG